MSFSLIRPLTWIFSTCALVACGEEFTASDGVDAGPGGSSGSGGSSSGAGGSTGGAGGSPAGAGGTGSGQGGASGAIGASGRGAGGSVSGQGGASGSVGFSGQGGAGGTVGASGRGGVGGSAGGSGTSGGISGSPGDAGPDSATCVPQGTVDSCGQRCEKCRAPNDRTVPTCNGSSCGFSCLNPDTKCSDNSCSRLLWTFDSGALDGLQSSSGHSLAVRTFNGSAALAVDVVQLNQGEISFTLPICLSGTMNLSAKTFSFRVHFAGGPATSGELYVGASLPDVATGYISDIYVGTAAWVTYSDSLSKSSQSGTAKTITIRLGSTGAPFSGTVWFDDFRIQ